MSQPRATLLLLVIMICPCVVPPAHSQHRDLKFEHISTPQGLSQDIVRAIVQDYQGFMWFGTEDGLNRYDGYSVKAYKHHPGDSTTISSNVINHLYEDIRGRLWIATFNGLNLYDRELDAFVHFSHQSEDPRSISANGVTSLAEDRHGVLWIATTSGLNRYDEPRQTFVRYYHDPNDDSSISADGIYSLLRDRAGTLWIGTSNGLCRYNEENNCFIRYVFEKRPTFHQRMTSLYEDSNRKLWVVQSENSVWRFDAATGALEHLLFRKSSSEPYATDRLSDGVVSTVAEDAKGFIWIGHFSGLDVFDPRSRTFTHYFPDPNDPASIGGRLTVIYRDRVGAMWLGTFQGGVNCWNPSKLKFPLYRHIPNSQNSPSGDAILAVLEDRAGFVWIGSDRGLDRFDPGTRTFIHFRHDPLDRNSLAANQITALFEDKSNNLWIGAGSGPGSSLDCLDPQRKRFTHHPIHSVRAILEDSEGNLWVGKLNEVDSTEDVVRLNQEREIVDRDTIPGTGVWVIYEDRRGYIWLGGQYCCLNRFDPKIRLFTGIEARQDNRSGPTSGAVRSIYEDEEGDFWFGTWGGGLNLYNPRTNTFSYIMEQDGLASNYVKGILPDDEGNLWISTERGLSRYDRNNRTFRNYTTDDGLQGDRFLSGSCFKGGSGWMYFGGTDGLNMFHPDSIRDNPNVPPIVITSFKVFDKPFFPAQSISSIGEIRLEYDQDFFSFEFVALDYTAPERNQYAYMMEGFDKEWVHSGQRRYAAYTDLDPGTYTFRVKGSNNDGIWNETGTSVAIIIDPPYWQTWWFRGGVVLVVAALLYGFYRYRVHKLLELERTRNRIARDLHDEIGATLGSISYFARAIKTESKEETLSQKYLSRITESAQEAQEAMDDIVWAINPANDSWENILPRFQRYASDLFESQRIRYSITIPQAVKAPPLSMEKRRDLWLIFKEMVTNATKHSACTEASIVLAVDGSTFELRVEDNGKGFDTAKPSARSGLKNIRTRASLLHARLDLDTAPGRGTRWRLRFQVSYQ